MHFDLNVKKFNNFNILNSIYFNFQTEKFKIKNLDEKLKYLQLNIRNLRETCFKCSEVNLKFLELSLYQKICCITNKSIKLIICYLFFYLIAKYKDITKYEYLIRLLLLIKYQQEIGLIRGGRG